MTKPLALNGPRVPPASGRPARHLVLLLHGYGADGNDLIGLAPYWQRLLPDAAFVAPNAPAQVPGMPFGYQWFGLSRYNPALLRDGDRAAAAALLGEMRDGVTEVADVLDSFVDGELQRLGLGDDKLALVGFSQGTMMALYLGFRRPASCAGIVGYSGALIGAERLAQELRCRPPVVLVHGDADEVVPVEAMFAAVEGLGAAQVPVQWHVRPGMAHGIDPEGLQIGGQFLRSVLT